MYFRKEVTYFIAIVLFLNQKREKIYAEKIVYYIIGFTESALTFWRHIRKREVELCLIFTRLFRGGESGAYKIPVCFFWRPVWRQQKHHSKETRK